MENLENWQSYAVEKDIHPIVISYVGAFAEQALAIGPRTWMRVSNIFKQEALSEEILQTLMEYQLGAAIGASIMEMYRTFNTLPDVDEILNGTAKAAASMDPSTTYALAVALAYRLKDESDKNVPDWQQRAGHTLVYATNNFQPEMVIMFAKFAIAILRLPFSAGLTPRFDEFAKRYREMVMR